MASDATVWLQYAAAASVILAVYLATLSPSIAGGDSGELVAEGCQLGTAHPPGYPLYTLMVHALTWLPYNSVAWRVNLMSSVLTAIAAVMAGTTVEMLTGRRIGAFLTMGMLAFSPLIWQYAITAEVFALNNFLICWMLCQTVRIGKLRTRRAMYLGAFICGLALCNQHTAVLFEAPLILWVLWICRDEARDVQCLLKLGFCFLAGLSPYLYLPITAHLNPRAGSWGDLATLSGFLHHLLRRDYGTFQLYSGGGHSEPFAQRIAAYVKDFTFRQGLYFVPALVLLGVWATLSKAKAQQAEREAQAEATEPKKRHQSKRRHNTSRTATFMTQLSQQHPVLSVGIALLVAQLTYLTVFHSLSNLPLSDPLLFGVHARFWMQPNILMFIWAGVGVDYLLPQNSSRIITSAVLLITVVAIALQVKLHFARIDQSEAWYFRNYAQAILEPLPQNAILLINYDMQWTSARYTQICEGFRPDISLINLSMMTYKWWKTKTHLYNNVTFPGTHYTRENAVDLQEGAFTLQDFIHANHNRGQRVFLSGKLTFSDKSLTDMYEAAPFGLASEFVELANKPTAEVWFPATTTAWRTVERLILPLPDKEKYDEETWEWTIGRDWLDRVTSAAAHLLELAIESEARNPRHLPVACYFLESATALEGSNAPSALLKNLGLCHLHLVRSTLPDEQPLPVIADVLHTLQHKTIDWPDRLTGWKAWSSLRFMDAWGRFVAHRDAKQDPQFDTISQLYTTVSRKTAK